MSTKQHVQVPHLEITELGLNHNDPFVYACIKKYMNGTTKKAFPSLTTLIRITGMSKETLISSIDRLEQAGYLTVNKRYGKSNEYIFNDVNSFEIFSYEFLDNPDIPKKTKATIVAQQHYMYKHPDAGLGTIIKPTQQLAKELGISTQTLRTREKEMQDLGILTIVPSGTKELIEANGCIIQSGGYDVPLRLYDFSKYFNMIALKFKETDERLDAHEEKFNEQEKRIKMLEMQLKAVTSALEAERADKTKKEDKIIL